MIARYTLRDAQVVPCEDDTAPIMVVTSPDEAERRMLVEQWQIDEHMLQSALDPDEQARLDFEPDYLAVVYKRPKNLSTGGSLLFRVGTAGLFLTNERLVIVVQDSLDVFNQRLFRRVRNLRDLMLRVMYYSITHFLEHMKVITMMSDELEQKLQTSMENKYLLHLFSLEKSMVYYVSALSTNAALIDKLRVNTGKFNFSEDDHEFLEDMTADSLQALRQAEMYSNILASMMDARASIVANNLNVVMKILTLITIGIMLPNLVVSLFSMNVEMPFQHDNPIAFWAILLLCISSVFVFMLFKRRMRW